MSDGEVAARAGGGSTVSGLERWQERTGTIFLSREEIARLAESGSHYVILSLAEQADDTASRAPAEAAARKQLRMRTTLHAIAVGACIGASTGLSVASTFLLMTHKAPVSIVAFLEHALTLFA
ncbi:MAG: hypothetical protein KJ587_06200 [Alphaproteobacteria bacterium]|nr:hypothetical protein [Alphaproteobacteria bacterium]